jgi:OOP family OmpA-OmpF porin
MTRSGRPLMGISRSLAALVTLGVVAAVVPIDVQDSVQPIEVQQDQGALTTVILSRDVLSAFNSSTLTATAQQTIDGLTARLRSSGAKRISVDGYTDSIGSVAYNLGLSRRRAAAVQRALSAALGGSGAPAPALPRPIALPR